MKKWLTTALIFVFMVCAAAMATGAGFSGQKPFTQDELNRFMKDWPPFTQWAESKGEEYDKIQAPAEGMRWSREMTQYLGKRGWKPERFFYVVSHVASGLAAVEMRQQAPGIASQLKAQKAMIESNPDIPAEQKKMMISQMEQAMGQTAQLKDQGKDIPAEEMELIRGNRQALKEVLAGD